MATTSARRTGYQWQGDPPNKPRHTPRDPKITAAELGAAVRLRWLRTARPNQLEPEGAWFVWLIRAGRGYGKTRIGAEWTVEHCRKLQDKARFHMVGQTFADVRDTMVEGESGLLSILPPSLLKSGSVERSWNRSLGQLTLSSGARLFGFSSEKPRQLRGPQCTSAWGDEPSTWADAHLGKEKDTTFSNLAFGCRMKSKVGPRIVLTGTPRAVLLMKQLMRDPRVAVTRGSSYENLANLAPEFRENVLEQYEGTRLGQQELHGDILEDVEGALWTSPLVEKTRSSYLLIADGWVELDRIVVAVDPSVKAKKTSDETGIVVVGRGGAPPRAPKDVQRLKHAYVLQDSSGAMSPAQWAITANDVRLDWSADRVVGETNNGGDLVEINLRTVDEDVPFMEVTASQGKRARAEEVVALYEKNRVHHVGVMGALEEQMTTWVPGDSPESPDRVDALVWGVWAQLLSQHGTGSGKAGNIQDRRLAGRR